MKHKLNSILVHALFGVMGGGFYFLIETIWKGKPTNWTMAVLGGLCFVIVGLLNEGKHQFKQWQQVVIGTVVITVLEGLTGVVLNNILHMGVWDYSHLPFTFFFGQCNLFFCCAWALLSLIAIHLEDKMHEIVDNM